MMDTFWWLMRGLGLLLVFAFDVVFVGYFIARCIQIGLAPAIQESVNVTRRIIVRIAHGPELGRPKCKGLHDTAKMEMEEYGEIKSDSIKEHVNGCYVTGFYQLRDEKVEDLNGQFAQILAAAQPANSVTGTAMVCPNGPAGITQHHWKTLGDRTFCTNCGRTRGK
jgi:hypothetical protein